jgi:serine protease Do
MDNKKFFVGVIIISLVAGFLGALFAFTLFSDGNNFYKNSTQSRQVTTTQESAVVNSTKKVSPSVVSVILTKDVPIMKEFWSPFSFFPEYEAQGTKSQKVGGGTGFIVGSNGLILTNKHVVQFEDVDYTVVLSNGKKYSAKVIARDPYNDIAVLKIEARGLRSVKLGDSSKLQVGQSVIAIGFALGEFPNTVSVGVISGLSRNISAGETSSFQIEEIQKVIQTDAAINQGNSGGPLLNLSGEVIGVNVAVASGAENIGFAIPINQVKGAISEVKERGTIDYPFLGVNYVLINQAIKEQYNLPINYGALVIKDDNGIAVVPGSAADKAGIIQNDIILEINRKKINEKNKLSDSILSMKVGDKINIKILRKGKEMNLNSVIESRK